MEDNYQHETGTAGRNDTNQDSAGRNLQWRPGITISKLAPHWTAWKHSSS